MISSIVECGVRIAKLNAPLRQRSELILWCNERGRENNAEARTPYAAGRLAEVNQQHLT